MLVSSPPFHFLTFHLHEREQSLSQEVTREGATGRGAGCCNTGSGHVIIVKSTLIACIYFAPVLEELYPFQPLDELNHLLEHLSDVKSKSTCHTWLKLDCSTQEVKGFAQCCSGRAETELRLVYHG